MAEPNEKLGVGGGAPIGGGPSLEAEEKAMRSGRGRMLAVMILAVVAAVGGLVLYMTSGGETEAYSTFGRNINGYRRQYFDGFWGCALRGIDFTQLKNNEELTSALHLRAQQGRRRYATHLRDECLPILAELGPKLQTLIPPEDLAAQLRELGDAVQSLRSGTSAWIAHIEGLGEEGSYDVEAESAIAHVTVMARAWYDYRRIHGQLNDAVAAKLER